jgi:hypothetical protein
VRSFKLCTGTVNETVSLLLQCHRVHLEVAHLSNVAKFLEEKLKCFSSCINVLLGIYS